jgi:antimicrobial peptide system SdpA family protein
MLRDVRAFVLRCVGVVGRSFSPPAPLTPSGSNPAQETRKVGAALLALCLGGAALVVYTVHGSLPHNALALPGETALSTAVWAPEGWKFFTRNPREEQTHLYVRNAAGMWNDADVGPNGSSRNLFGLSRQGRAQPLEYGALLKDLPKEAWRDCDGSPEQCLEHALVAKTLSNTSVTKTLCGTVGIVRQKPVPWAWAKSKRPVVMPSRVVRLEVSC